MNNNFSVTLLANSHQSQVLKQLQAIFSDVCNEISPIAQKNQCWNRVALHHLVYHSLRVRYPSLGSQMICNAVYSVARTYKMVINLPNGPVNLAKYPEKGVPLIHFFDTSPVYFDRHTLSLRKRKISLFTLEGRILFDIDASDDSIDSIRKNKLKEIKLVRNGNQYCLNFNFSSSIENSSTTELPDYFVLIKEELNRQEKKLSANELINYREVS